MIARRNINEHNPKTYHLQVIMINFHIDWLLICINISIDEKFKQIRQFDSIYDWTSQRDDSIVKEHIIPFTVNS